MDVSKNSGTPKSSILIGVSIINHPFWSTPIFGNPHMVFINSNSEDETIGSIYSHIFFYTPWKSKRPMKLMVHMVHNFSMIKVPYYKK